ncbi:putative retrotransposon hot spot (RHS) protein [Trypanosoma cruzi]|uniref:Putative retrotransposon hot spot (RHS) protein n=1 Tax=Trypanosoma cruzi TaxID=5693 RepID=A0A2V2UFE2_TRYCR|nr:putative retrotransposon hot spot (RHS) protein [Trypanosoma cruzi]
MRGGIMSWKFLAARGREWRCMRANHRSHGLTRQLAEPSKRMTVWEQSGAPRLRLMVLTSGKAWPHPCRREINDCYVNCEVDRVWQIVKGDLTELFSSRPEDHFTPHPRVLIGTPGIGKSMAAGSYLLYQLLHCDAELLPMVAYSFGSTTYVFNKTTETVTSYMGKSMMIKAVKELSRRGMKGYIIYEALYRLDIPSPFLPPGGWGMLVVATPETTSYIHWANEKRAVRIIMNCPDESDVKAICVWKKRNQCAQQQAEYWREVKGHMDKLGPILRYIFDEGGYKIGLAVATALWIVRPLGKSSVTLFLELPNCGRVIMCLNILRGLSEYEESAMASRLSMYR